MMGTSSACQKLLAFPTGYLKSQKTASDAFIMNTKGKARWISATVSILLLFETHRNLDTQKP